jgi:hypothetical protein
MDMGNGHEAACWRAPLEAHLDTDKLPADATEAGVCA